MQNLFITIGAIAFIIVSASEGMNGHELMAMGALGGGVGGLCAAFCGFHDNSAPE